MSLSDIEKKEKYEDGLGSYSLYPVTRSDKKTGERIPDGYGIAFYYLYAENKKERKVFSGKDKAALLKKRIDFLIQMQMERQQKPAAPVSPHTPVSPLSMASPLAPVSPAVCQETVKSAMETYMAGYKKTVAFKTYQAEKSNANKINAIMGNKKITEVTFQDFQNLVNEVSKGRNGKAAAEKTVDNIIILFKRLMKFCRRNKWITADDLDIITSDVRIPTYVTDNNHAQEVKESKFLTYEEAGETLRILEDNPRYYLTLRILFLTGLRPQEFFALEHQDLNRNEQYIEIRQALVVQERRKESDRMFGIGTTKNRTSIRKVPAIPKVFEYFDELENLLKSSGSRLAAIEKGNGNKVLVDRNGNIVDEHSFGTNMSRYLKRRGAARNVTLGMPRHCYQDYLDELGANDKDVEKAVGHTIPSVSERNYKVRALYLKRLLPYLERMEKELEAAYQKARQGG